MLALVHQIAGEFRLTIDRDPLAAREAEKVDAMLLSVEGERKAIVLQSFGMQTRRGAARVHHPDRSFLEHAGTHSSEDMILARAIQDDVFYAGPGKQLAKQQPGRTRADYRDLGAHDVSPTPPANSMTYPAPGNGLPK